MQIEKQTIIDLISVTDNGLVHVRTATRFIEDGMVASQSFHRHVITPGQDYSNEDARVQAICAATHTAEVIDAYKAASTAQGV